MKCQEGSGNDVNRPFKVSFILTICEFSFDNFFSVTLLLNPAEILPLVFFKAMIGN